MWTMPSSAVRYQAVASSSASSTSLKPTTPLLTGQPVTIAVTIATHNSTQGRNMNLPGTPALCAARPCPPPTCWRSTSRRTTTPSSPAWPRRRPPTSASCLPAQPYSGELRRGMLMPYRWDRSTGVQKYRKKTPPNFNIIRFTNFHRTSGLMRLRRKKERRKEARQTRGVMGKRRRIV